jgi:hypothetical protein
MIVKGQLHAAADRGGRFSDEKKGGEEEFVSDQEITQQEKLFVTLIRRMEVKQ